MKALKDTDLLVDNPAFCTNIDTFNKKKRLSFRVMGFLTIKAIFIPITIKNHATKTLRHEVFIF